MNEQTQQTQQRQQRREKNVIAFEAHTDGSCINNGKPNATGGVGIVLERISDTRDTRDTNEDTCSLMKEEISFEIKKNEIDAIDGIFGGRGQGKSIFFAESTEKFLEKLVKGLGIKKITNNVSEYLAAIIALYRLLEIKRDIKTLIEVTIKMDSLLVVSQMNGVWKVKDPVMKSLHSVCSTLSFEFEKISWNYIPRELNREADRLSRECLM